MTTRTLSTNERNCCSLSRPEERFRKGSWTSPLPSPHLQCYGDPESLDQDYEWLLDMVSWPLVPFLNWLVGKTRVFAGFGDGNSGVLSTFPVEIRPPLPPLGQGRHQQLWLQIRPRRGCGCCPWSPYGVHGGCPTFLGRAVVPRPRLQGSYHHEFWHPLRAHFFREL